MTVKQISILLKNKPGMMSDISEMLGKEGVNIGAMMLSESTDISIVRMITNDPMKTLKLLNNAGYHAWDVNVIAVVTPDHPGALNAVLKPLATAGINVNYFYAHLKKYEDNAIIIFRVDDLEKGIEALKKEWVQVLGEELYSL